MVSKEPQLMTTDDRLSRIENMLIRMSNRLDHIEKEVSKLSMAIPPINKSRKEN
jgi:hypothetical protein